MSKKNFLFVSILILLGLSCKKSSSRTIEIEKETRDWVVFQPGTWWVYKNINNNFIDTWKVVGMSEGLVLADEFSISNYKYINVNIQSKYKDTFYLYIENEYCYLSTNKYFGLDQMCFHNGINPEISSCDNNKLRLIKSDTTNGVCTSKVFDTYPYSCTSFFPAFFEWQRNVGLRKMVYNIGDTLELINQKIIQ